MGKSWLIAVYAVIKCILYPGSKVCVTSSKLKQAVEVLKKISNELCLKQGFGSELLNAEIKKILLNGEDPQIIFHNGSFIYAVAANKNARSKRSTDNIYDEFVQMDPTIINDVLEPFLTSKRQPGFINNAKYANDVEENSEFYLSSAWYQSEWSFGRVQDYIENMLLGDSYFSCSLPYQLSIESGLLSPSRIKAVYKKRNFDPIKFAMEYEAIWFGSSGSEFFSYEDIKPRCILNDSLPIPDNVMLNKSKVPEPKFNERRILSLDVALMASNGNKNNDAACIIINDAIMDNSYTYNANIRFVETFEGLRTEELGSIAMEYYYKYKCTDIVVDARGNGQGVIDHITKEQHDRHTGEILIPFKAVNDVEWANRCKSDTYTKSLWIINGSPKLNDEANNYVRNGFLNNKLSLLISEYDCYNYLIETVPGFENKNDKIQLNYQKPYIETALMINEMINLEWELVGVYVKVEEKSGMRKDRYSSLAYNIWVMKQLEFRLEPELEEDIEFDDLPFRQPNLGISEGYC
ncbi:hypothetical protein CWE04_11765 [Thomasclavelia cocleata]|nr:hypothetical protein CWE04_11765 [Thomasclavelia cocleata]